MIGKWVQGYFWFAILMISSFHFNLGSDRETEARKAVGSDQKRHITLVGASIGRAWNFFSLAERLRRDDYIFEFVDTGSFDKTLWIKEILARPQNKPDVIIIKECAAYFPGDFSRQKSLVEEWMKECHEANVLPVLATVIPVTRLHSFKKILIDIVKLRNPLKYGNPFRQKRNKAILEYNDWVREYCQRNGWPCLDLEAAVRYSEKKRYLRRDLAKLDGLHVNSKAYKILDQMVISALEKINWEERGRSRRGLGNLTEKSTKMEDKAI